MKFLEKFTNGGGRVGCLTEIAHAWRRSTNTTPHLAETPTYLQYTCAGCVPHLTHDNIAANNESSWILQPLPTVVDFKGSVERTNSGSLGHFVGLPAEPSCLTHVSMQDPAVATPSGYNSNLGVAVWTRGGKRSISPAEFMEVQNSFVPFSYQALCDSDTPQNCKRKRLVKSITNTLSYLDQCLKIHSGLPRLKHTSVFGTIQGGYDLDLRRKSAKETAERRVDGFVIDGFHSNGLIIDDLQFFKIEPILKELIQCLPSDKLRVMNGPLSPSSIVKAVACGIDVFDSSYAHVLSETGKAFSFRSTEQIYSDKNVFVETDLKDASYADSFQPISKFCRCYTCANFTCAYIHHLITASELLGRVLLMMHNLHQMSDLFSYIRKSIESGNFHQLQKTYQTELL